jgi:Uma2 family endonuclease
MPDPSEIEFDKIRPMRREEYERLNELGFYARERIELLDGLVVQMSPTGMLHVRLTMLLGELFTKAIPPHLIVGLQTTYALSAVSEPEPDLVIVERETLRTSLPTGALLVIEVADSSLTRDRGIKARLYAAGGVPDYWIVNAKDLTIEVHREPGDNGYRSIVRYERTARVAPLLLPDITVCLDELLK